MKEPKQKSQLKSERKTAKADVKEHLLSALKGMFEKEKIKLTKKVKKRSQKLVKTIAKELAEVKPAAVKAVKEVKTAVIPKSVKKPAEPKLIKPAKKVVVSDKASAKITKPSAVKTKTVKSNS